MTREGDKPKRRKGNTGRAKASQAREIEPEDNVRLGDRLTRGREVGDPGPRDQLRLLESYRWKAIARSAEAMEELPVRGMNEAEILIKMAERYEALYRNLDSVVSTMAAASVETEFETLTDEQQTMYAELYPELFATAPTPDGPN